MANPRLPPTPDTAFHNRRLGTGTLGSTLGTAAEMGESRFQRNKLISCHRHPMTGGKSKAVGFPKCALLLSHLLSATKKRWGEIKKKKQHKVMEMPDFRSGGSWVTPSQVGQSCCRP